ncbi:MAG: amino acid adenylation domain-containing protein [Verrucomicrobiota bacterium]
MPVPDSISRDAAVPLHRLLHQRAALRPDELAYRFLSDGETTEETLTLGQLSERSNAIAAALVRHGATGQPVLLIQPPGLAFIEGLFACWQAGAIAVPAYPPRGGRHKQRLAAILADSGARLAIAPTHQPEIPGVTLLDGDFLAQQGGTLPEIFPDPALPSLLQYTSGSTADPKGVMISHRNIHAHFTALRNDSYPAFRSAVSWLPPYHDLGLILKILYPFESGIPLTFFSPEHFIQRPARWLEAISRFRGDFSGAPNFAYEMCLRAIPDEEISQLDLSCWKVAACGAERVRPETLQRFAERFAPAGFQLVSFHSGYGLAESTLTVTGHIDTRPPRVLDHPQHGKLVSSGPPLPGIALRIAHPDDHGIGEILLSGEMIASGYWQRPTESRKTFVDGELHTGDLGFVHDGELYITGRIKDLIIIDGTNHSPDDLESIAFATAPEITAAAAFSMDHGQRESVVLAVETDRLSPDRQAAICREIRQAIGERLELSLARVVIVRNGLLPRTTSGKIRRAATREALTHDKLRLAFDDASDLFQNAPSAALDMLMQTLREVTGRDGILPDDDITGSGMTSVDAIRLAAALKSSTGHALSLGEIFAARSFHQLATQLKITPKPALPATTGETLLTHAQERMWLLHQLDPTSAAYHIFGTLELTGPLDCDALQRALVAVASRHDILNSRHSSDNGRPTVRIVAGVPIPVEIAMASDDTRSQLATFASRPFRLADEAPLRALILSCGSHRHLLALCVHHIAADGWSLRQLADEIARSYAGESLPSSAPSYLAYATGHRQWIDSGAVDAQIAWWKSRLDGHPGTLALATDFPRPAQASSAGDIREQTLPIDLRDAVSAIARNHRATPFMVHLAAFLLLLRRHGAGHDAVVAIPVANRNHAGADSLVGTLVNTLPFRLPLDPTLTFSGLIDAVRTATLEMQDHQDAPFEKIIAAVNPDRSSDHSPLAQVMFDYQEIPLSSSWTTDLQATPFHAHRGAVQFDLSLLITVLGDRQQLGIEFRNDLFLPATVERLLARHLETLRQICANPALPLAEISSLSRNDIAVLETHAQGPFRPNFPLTTTPTLIAARAAAAPHRCAVTAGSATLDYRTLAARSDILAARLYAAGVRPGDRLAVLMERDATLPVALLAIWKTGAAYVPLDRANPPERLKLILDDQAPIRVLASPGLTVCLPSGTAILLEDHLPAAAPDFIPHRHSPQETAYIIYTSGSTGKPKGVVISHGALANFLLSMAETPGINADDRLLAVTTLSFDIFALEIFLPLIAGARVDIVSTETARDGHALLAHLTATAPTLMQATPATWRLLIESGWHGSPNLVLLCGGEALDLPLATTLRPLGKKLWNLYGPTETTVWSSLWEVPEKPTHIRIGQPIANTGLHVLAPDGQPLPPGVPGDLWISGSGLADSYWQRPDLTAAAFVSARYRTGDVARLHADGSFECLGRSDGQVKIRGFRVELGEIEAALALHPAVAHAKVALRGCDAASRKLVAWIIPRLPENPPSAYDLRDFLIPLLPPYMLPAEIGVIDRFPLGSSGKVDVSRLETPASTPQPTRSLTPTELRLTAIWNDLLGRHSCQLSDDWFHVGGQSLLALRLFSRIRTEFGRSLPLSTILDRSTLAALAETIDATPPDPAP